MESIQIAYRLLEEEMRKRGILRFHLYKIRFEPNGMIMKVKYVDSNGELKKLKFFFDEEKKELRPLS